MLTSSINRIALTGTLLTIVSIAGGCSSIDRFAIFSDGIENLNPMPVRLVHACKEPCIFQGH